MDKPFSRWYCDVCGGPIEGASKAYVVWHILGGRAGYFDGFQIIHKGKCDDHSRRGSGPLEEFLGVEGLSYLLSFLSEGPLFPDNHGNIMVRNLDRFTDFFRRVQMPLYEEARRWFRQPEVLNEFAEAGCVVPYQLDSLKRIVRREIPVR